MQKEQTVELLRQCNAGIKTAVNSIEAVLPKTENEHLAALLDHYLEEHEALGDEVHQALNRLGEETRDPSPMTRMMAGSMISMKYAMQPKDETIADLMCDGCAMGTRKLYHTRNLCKEATSDAQDLVTRLIDTENKMVAGMTPYL